jgi:RNA polymerase sigma factor (sigma-70 family)
MGLRASRPVLAGHDDPAAATLPARAAAGDQGAWDEIVERYAPMVWSICTSFRLSDRDLEDVAQNVWLQLVEQLGRLPEPATPSGSLGRWLAATTRRECLRVVAAARGPQPPGTEPPGTQPDDAVIGEEVIAAERNAALRAALAELPPSCQPLIGMLVSDPPPSYTAISTALGIPVESIGPRRARCLERIRESSARLGLAEVGANRPGGDPGA